MSDQDTRILSNGEIADRLMSLAQLLAAQRENPFKVKAYRRAAKTIAALGESVSALVSDDEDLTQYAGIGNAISSVIREVVHTGTVRQLEALRSQASPELAGISQHPRLDAKRILSVYKKLNIGSIEALKEKLDTDEIRNQFGLKMEHHIRRGLTEAREMLLYHAEDLVAAIEEFLLTKCRVRRAEVTGDYRRRVEVLAEISFLIETDDFPAVLSRLQQYGGRTELLSSDETSAQFKLHSGALLAIQVATKNKWGVAFITSTGAEAHLQKLEEAGADWETLATSPEPYSSEEKVYRTLCLSYIEPEIREGRDEVELAARGPMPKLVTASDIRGELHAHTTSSDGSYTIEEMACGARKKGYEYLGISDHSQSLKIARGLPEEKLWVQIRLIDELNEKIDGIRILKSAEVDILADGSLDYSDSLLKELDYTVCSIHSRFNLGREEQTARVLRAMDNPYFTILGHPTGRLLLNRPGYDLDMDRIVQHARERGCFFEINSSPDRLDLSAGNARLAREAGVMIAITTDAHSLRDFEYVRFGIDQARRAGLEKSSILNCLSWPDLQRAIRR